VRLGFAALIFHRHWPRRFADIFDHIGPPGDPKRPGAQCHAAFRAHAWPGFRPARIHPLVQQAACGGGAILGPDLLDMDQRALPRAEHIVLEGRERDEGVFVPILRHQTTVLRAWKEALLF